ncbi:MAG: methylenetetrahydrofolate reductase C-terminal domain-containing protein [Acidimicrobiia bacterium]
MNQHGRVDTACPKTMRFGPCGGVRNGGACEVDARPCPFVTGPVATPPARRAVPLPFVTSERTLIVDVRAPRAWNGDARSLWRATAAALDGSVALLGEHVDNPSLLDDAGALAPEEVVAILARAGVATVVTITGRDRDIDGASRRIARYRDAGAAAIHCVTGDHPLAVGLERPAYSAPRQ